MHGCQVTNVFLIVSVHVLFTQTTSAYIIFTINKNIQFDQE